MRRREASINNVPIAESDRRIFGPRPEAEQRAGVSAALSSEVRPRAHSSPLAAAGYRAKMTVVPAEPMSMRPPAVFVAVLIGTTPVAVST